MSSYAEAVKTQFKSAKTTILVLIFTVARIVYGLAWLKSGIGKAGTWLSDGKLNSAGKINTLVTNIAGEKVTSFDPLYLNKLFGWIAQHIFLSMPAFTDFLVVTFEILVGVLMILGFRVFWGALIAIFMNIQFIAAGSFNNFGYIWTNIILMNFAKYAEVIGIDGYLKARKGKSLT